MWRSTPDGGVEVALIHRPAYDDWTFPKGKLYPGESDREAALREVEEETGYRCRLGRELPALSYRDRRGRAKTVRYWEMRPEEGRFEPNAEVDQLRWLPLDRAAEALTYPHDRELLNALVSLVPAAASAPER